MNTPAIRSEVDLTVTSVTIETASSETISAGGDHIPLIGSDGDSSESLQDGIAEHLTAPPPAYYSIAYYSAADTHVSTSLPPPAYSREIGQADDQSTRRRQRRRPAKSASTLSIVGHIAKLVAGILIVTVALLIDWKNGKFRFNQDNNTETLSNATQPVNGTTATLAYDSANTAFSPEGKFAELMGTAGFGKADLMGLECFVVGAGSQLPENAAVNDSSTVVHLWDFEVQGNKCAAVDGGVLNLGDEVRVLSNDTIYAHCDGLHSVHYWVSVVGTNTGMEGVGHVEGYFPGDYLECALPK